MVFSLEKGLFSDFIKSKPFVFLGTISFTIYMTHSFLQGSFQKALEILDGKLHLGIFIQIGEKKLIGHEMWQGDLINFAMFVGVLVASRILYVFLEKPANDWFRNYKFQAPALNAP